MIYLLALLPATMLTVAGYFVLVLSTRAEGPLRAFGRYLGFWAFTLAGLVILGAIFAAAQGRHHGPVWMHGMHGGMHCPWSEGPHPGWPMGPHPPPGPAPGPPVAPGAPVSPESAPPAQR